MFIRAIRLSDVLSGDVVCVEQDRPIKVKRIGVEEDGRTLVLVDEEGLPRVRGPECMIIGLVHRAQSPAEALRVATDILKSIRTLMSQVERDADCDEALSRVREAIEAYELGKPLRE